MTDRNRTPTASLNWPLMQNNIPREDLDAVIDCSAGRPDPHAVEERPRLRRGVVATGSACSTACSSTPARRRTCVTLAALKELHGAGGEIIVPTITWVSDIAAVLHCGFTPVFVDIDPRTLGMDNEEIAARNSHRETRAVFLTHVLGYNASHRTLLDELKRRDIPLIEDVCESHGATFNGRKLGTFGLASNFSFYYAHHLSTIEGGHGLHRRRGLVRDACA